MTMTIVIFVVGVVVVVFLLPPPISQGDGAAFDSFVSQYSVRSFPRLLLFKVTQD